MKIFWGLAVLFSTLVVAHGQGTVQLITTIATRVQVSSVEGTIDVPLGFPIVYGLFAGSTLQSLSLVTPLGEASTNTAGQISVTGASAMSYVIPGFAANTQPFLQVRAWSASFGSDWQAAFAAAASPDHAVYAGVYVGATDIIQSSPLGADFVGPGILIWQSASGTNPNRFTPLLVYTPIPEPSTIALFSIGGLIICLRRARKPY